MTLTTATVVQYVTTRVGQLAVETAGTPGTPAVMLRHGIFLDRELWRPFVASLAETHRVVLVDAPGHGASRNPGRPYSLQDDARAGLEILDALGIECATFVGHSWGGMSAIRAALLAPERVSGLVLINTPLRPRSASERARYRMLTLLLRAIGAPRWYGRQVAAALFDAGERDGVVARRMIEWMRLADRASLARAMRAVLIRPDDVSDRLGELTMPVTALAGVDDYVLDETAASLLRVAVAHARIEHVPGNHVTPAEQPHEVARLLAQVVR